mgnify:CR=1 FL=1
MVTVDKLEELPDKAIILITAKNKAEPSAKEEPALMKVMYCLMFWNEEYKRMKFFYNLLKGNKQSIIG